MKDYFLKNAKEYLKNYKPKHKHNATYRGISVSEFDREELLKIIDMYASLVILKDRMIERRMLNRF